MFGRNHKPINDPRAEHARKKSIFFTSLAAKLNGADERKAAAQAKRERRAQKRFRDDGRSAEGQRFSTHALSTDFWNPDNWHVRPRAGFSPRTGSVDEVMPTPPPAPRKK